MSKVTKIKTFDEVFDDEEELPPPPQNDDTSKALQELAAAIKLLVNRPAPTVEKTDLSPLLTLIETLKPQTPKAPAKKKWEFDVQRNSITGDIQKILAVEK